MESRNGTKVQPSAWPPFSPWTVTFAGSAACALALALVYVQRSISGDSLAAVLVPVRAILIFLGLVLAGGGISLRLRTATWEFEERAVSAALTSVAAFSVFIGFLALDKAWDSMGMVLLVLTVLGFAGVGLILLPRLIRRIVFLVVVFFHFCGILTAVTSAPPHGNSQPPWLTQQLWTRIYRPYLQFMYLNNAYHFYSPEPGPACQLWFYVKFTDGTGEWMKMPYRKSFATQQEYQRMLAFTESTNQLVSQPPDDYMVLRRRTAGERHAPTVIPMHPEIRASEQFNLPNPSSMLMIKSYARFVGQNYRSTSDPDKKVQSVVMYRALHRILSTTQFAEGIDPNNPISFYPYFQGEFDKDGEMITKADDGFLYWLIPIVYEPKDRIAQAKNLAGKKLDLDDLVIVDYCKAHAGDTSK